MNHRILNLSSKYALLFKYPVVLSFSGKCNPEQRKSLLSKFLYNWNRKFSKEKAKNCKIQGGNVRISSLFLKQKIKILEKYLTFCQSRPGYLIIDSFSSVNNVICLKSST